MKRTQGEYALYLNRKHHRASGHLWQSRYYSALVSPDHVWMVLRYIERNPVRARLITEPGRLPWSSAKHHLAPNGSSSALDLNLWAEAWSPSSWAEVLREIEPESDYTVRGADSPRLSNRIASIRQVAAEHRKAQLDRAWRRTAESRLNARHCATTSLTAILSV